MENRFTFKDLIVLLSLGVLIALVVLAMVQFDRQYKQVLTVKSQNDQLASEVARIKRQIADLATSGVAVTGASRSGAGTGNAAASAGTDAFTHLLAAEEQEDFARGGWFIDNFGTKVGKLTPFLGQDVYATWIQLQVQDTFAVRDPYTLEYVPRLARSWEISPDGLTMRFFMRDDVSFSDGHPLTADDVVFTYDWVRNPEVNAPRERAYLTYLDTVTKIDDYTVEFVFSELYYQNFEAAAAMGIMPEHFYSRYTPDQFNESVGLLMGSGPYMLENPETWAPGNGVTLLRNPRYWGVPPTFDRMVFNEIQEEAAEQVRYGNQEHDIIRCLPAMYENLLKDERVMAFSQDFRVSSPYSGYIYIGWNQKRTVDGRDEPTWFADKRVRQAMTMLIDRERLCREIFLGYATVANGPFAPSGQQADPDIEPWPYDPERAKQLLADAGYEDRNGDGVIEDETGRPFRFQFTYPGGSETYENIVLFLRDNLARGGVVMQPERLDWPVLLNRVTQGDFASIILGWSGTPESDPYQIFHSSQVGDQGDNRTHYINPELDAAIEEARKTMDTEKRMELWHRVHQILHEDQPYTFMTNRDRLYLINERVRNVEPASVGLNFEYLTGQMIPWYIPKAQQQMAR